MSRLKAVLYRSVSLALVIFMGLVCARSDVANADSNIAPVPAGATLTDFENFVLYYCVPCVREVYSVATVPIPSLKAPTFSGLVPVNPAPATRAGEVRFELLRAYPVGLEAREHMAMRVVLLVATGSPVTTGPSGTTGSQTPLYPVGAGLLDEDEVPALAAALSQMSKPMPSVPGDASLQLVETEFHADMVRVGTLRTENDHLAYVQVAPPDIQRFALKQVWELPVMYLPSKDIPTLEHSVRQVSTKIRSIRGR
jgi:hypothetical protein